ncbi:myelin-associated glycoprotein-like isoform X2 [Hyperolius riggenbachi]|uniref:myelin-associated glycoprotein-like isoform X2 n=1 Tax=Hyperolius riggenbachi TaxID=752182 RepID=UPI0035A390FE
MLLQGSGHYLHYCYIFIITVSYLWRNLTTKPVISTGSSLVAGEEVTLSCMSPGICRKEPQDIIWQGNILNATTASYVINHENGTKSVFFNITFTARREQNQQSISCTVELSEGLTTKQKITLNVLYPPSVDIAIVDPPSVDIAIVGVATSDDNIAIRKGDSQRMECTVDSNPEGNITWYKDELLIHGPIKGQSLPYELQNVTPNDTGVYSCSAQNDHGTANGTVRITVQYPPKSQKMDCFTAITASSNVNTVCPMDANESMFALKGSQLFLICSADSVPEPDFLWTSPNVGRNISSSTNKLILPNVSSSDEGSYSCQARNSLGTSSGSITIKMTYGPKTVDGGNSSCWQKEKLIQCVCVIQSFPEATLEWKINGYASNHTNKERNISTVTADRFLNSTLTLFVTENNYPTVQCVTSNKYGELVLELFGKKGQPPFNAFLVAAAGAGAFAGILIIIGILFIIYCRKRRLKHNNDISKQMDASDVDAIYSNTEMCFNDSQDQQKDHQLPPEDEPATLEYGEMQYASIDFSKLKRNTNIETVETEYSEVKRNVEE